MRTDTVPVVIFPPGQASVGLYPLTCQRGPDGAGSGAAGCYHYRAERWALGLPPLRSTCICSRLWAIKAVTASQRLQPWSALLFYTDTGS